MMTKAYVLGTLDTNAPWSCGASSVAAVATGGLSDVVNVEHS